MNRILALFRERDTRDELGVGVIRDLLADEFFLGTSTIQTRLRYISLEYLIKFYPRNICTGGETRNNLIGLMLDKENIYRLL